MRRMRLEMAEGRGCGRPSPPCLEGVHAMLIECGGMAGLEVMGEMIDWMRESYWRVKGLSHVFQC